MNQQKENKLFTNMTSYAALQLVNILVGLYLPRLYLAVYGSEVNGVISTINSFVSYFSYLEAGLGLTLIHALFKPLATGDSTELNGILSFSKKQYTKISVIYFLLVVALSVIFPFISTANALGKAEFMALVFVIGCYGALDFFTMAKYRVLLTADRKEYVITGAMILAQILRFVFTWILLRFDISVVFIKIVPIFTLAVRSAILYLYVKKKYPKVNYSVPACNNVEITGERWDAMLLQISISTGISLPTIIVSRFFGFMQTNVFSVYVMVVNVIIGLVSALSSGVAPMLGRSIAQKKSVNKIYNLYNYVVSLIITAVFSTAVVLIIPFIKLYTNVVDDINYIIPEYAILICIWGAVYCARIPMTAVINAAGIYKKNRPNILTNIVLQVVAGILAAQFFGIPGLIVVMILTSLQRNLCFSFVNSKEFMKNKLSKTVLFQISMILMIFVNYILLSPVFSKYEYTAFSWCVAGALLMVVEIVACGCVFSLLDKESAVSTLSMIKNKFLNKLTHNKDD